MLIRPDGDASILIAQPAHAWVSGQIARAWEDHDGPFTPREEVCLAAEQHDIGWLTWESSPALNPETGLPFTFREIPRREHIQIWTRARRFALNYNRYSALLISRHGTGLFERYGPSADSPKAEQDQVAGFLRREHVAQDRLIQGLAADPRYSEFITEEILDRNSSLISIWDGMSLMICSGLDDDGATIGDYTLVPRDEGALISVDPWPFATDRVSLVVEGRRLTDRYDRQITLQAALNRVNWVSLTFDLVPAGDQVLP